MFAAVPSRRDRPTVAAAAARIVHTTRRLADYVGNLNGWRRSAAAFLAGLLSVAAMAPFFVTPVLFLTLPVLIWLIDGIREAGTPRSAFLSAAKIGWWFGFGYFLLGLFWIGEAFLVEAEKFAWLMPFAVTLMPAGLALFTGLAAGAARLVWRPGFARVLTLAVCLGMTEWLRGHVLTGFPWNVLGYALTWPVEVMQSASVVGIYGLTLLAVVIFGGPLVLLADGVRRDQYPRAVGGAVLLAVVPLLTMYAVGAWRLSKPTLFVDGARVRIVQPSIPQRDKWRPEKQREIFEDHIAMSLHDPSGRRDDLAGITHVIWPEAAMPFLPLEQPQALEAIGAFLPAGTRLLSGALRVEKSARAGDPLRAFNSLMVFGDTGSLEQVYDKVHLVPFGEYLPMQSLLESVGLEQLTRWRGGFSSGPEPRPLMDIPGLPTVSALVCYEAIFPSLIDQSGRAQLLINVTNDGWFGDSTGPWQHFHQSRVRAVEQGVPLVRVANNGVSAVVDAHGQVVAMLSLNVRGVLDADIPASIAAPIYPKLGDSTFVALALIFAGVAVVLSCKRGD
jgi:apolipoprotein N-acyltransferase